MGTPSVFFPIEHDILVLDENGAENITKFGYGPDNNIIDA